MRAPPEKHPSMVGLAGRQGREGMDNYPCGCRSRHYTQADCYILGRINVVAGSTPLDRRQRDVPRGSSRHGKATVRLLFAYDV